VEESCQLGMSGRQQGHQDSPALEEITQRGCAVSSLGGPQDQTWQCPEEPELISQMTLLWAKSLTRNCFRSLSRRIFLWFHNEIRAATYKEKNEVKEHPIPLVPTQQPLTSAAFASTVERVRWHCLHQRAGCLKYHCSCTASAHLSQSYNCN